MTEEVMNPVSPFKRPTDLKNIFKNIPPEIF